MMNVSIQIWWLPCTTPLMPMWFNVGACYNQEYSSIHLVVYLLWEPVSMNLPTLPDPLAPNDDILQFSNDNRCIDFDDVNITVFIQYQERIPLF